MDSKTEIIKELLNVIIKENITENEKLIKEIKENVLDTIKNTLNYKEIIK